MENRISFKWTVWSNCAQCLQRQLWRHIHAAVLQWLGPSNVSPSREVRQDSYWGRSDEPWETDSRPQLWGESKERGREQNHWKDVFLIEHSITMNLYEQIRPFEKIYFWWNSQSEFICTKPWFKKMYFGEKNQRTSAFHVLSYKTFLLIKTTFDELNNIV